jgi:hypothetical protein
MLKYPKPSRIKKCYKKSIAPESSLQSFADDYLAIKGIRSIRIPDGIFRYVQVNTSIGFRAWFNKTFAGLPDNLLLKPCGKYMRACAMELKTETGVLHGKQKIAAKEEGWIIARTPEEIMKTIDEFIHDN